MGQNSPPPSIFGAPPKEYEALLYSRLDPMTKSVGVHEAKTHLSRLLDDVAAGEEILITRRGAPAARLVALGTNAPRAFGVDRGRLAIPEDFDAPLDDEVLNAFES
jgi:prevent-host-death family protein